MPDSKTDKIKTLEAKLENTVTDTPEWIGQLGDMISKQGKSGAMPPWVMYIVVSVMTLVGGGIGQQSFGISQESLDTSLTKQRDDIINDVAKDIANSEQRQTSELKLMKAESSTVLVRLESTSQSTKDNDRRIDALERKIIQLESRLKD